MFILRKGKLYDEDKNIVDMDDNSPEEIKLTIQDDSSHMIYEFLSKVKILHLYIEYEEFWLGSIGELVNEGTLEQLIISDPYCRLTDFNESMDEIISCQKNLKSMVINGKERSMKRIHTHIKSIYNCGKLTTYIMMNDDIIQTYDSFRISFQQKISKG